MIFCNSSLNDESIDRSRSSTATRNPCRIERTARHASNVGRTAPRLVMYTTTRFSEPGMLTTGADVAVLLVINGADGSDLWVDDALLIDIGANGSDLCLEGAFLIWDLLGLGLARPVFIDRVNWLARRTRWKIGCRLLAPHFRVDSGEIGLGLMMLNCNGGGRRW
ncbi:hypothetical protein E3N88_17791 [Mikania micrantha]|uniref:Uncharacterized protein n=1 Tax=Mikania micrantha TaxID=192012 RepID=A0A5N6NV30_9ASTR|nr:hypothetical protein E3N88_17791 [Mikania micrantha]